MDTQVLTLFDDEYLEPKPEPKKKSGPKPAAKKGSAPVAQVDTPPYETPNITEGDELDKEIKNAIQVRDYFEVIHKELPKEPVIKRERSAIIIEGVVEKKQPAARKEEPKIEQAPQPDESVGIDTATNDLLPEWDLEDRYYSIGEVARLFGVNNSHIRFWTSEFKLKPRTTRKGGRLYNKEDIERLRLIHHLVKEKKHTIKGAREKLKVEKKAVAGGLSLKESLTELRDKLIAIRDHL